MSAHGLDLLRLLQLASPALPIGAYHYSQGLESAIEVGSVHDKSTLEIWLRDQLELNLGRFEAPIFLRLYNAWTLRDYAGVSNWNDQFLAARETSELRAETLQMAKSLRKLLVTLSAVESARMRWLESCDTPTMPMVFSLAASGMNLARIEALQVYLWTWLENQVTAALKTFALGQSAAQSLLFALSEVAAEVANAAGVVEDDELANSCPGLAVASASHETQYSRLFRS